MVMISLYAAVNVMNRLSYQSYSDEANSVKHETDVRRTCHIVGIVTYVNICVVFGSDDSRRRRRRRRRE
jgi:hypothetical protein